MRIPLFAIQRSPQLKSNSAFGRKMGKFSASRGRSHSTSHDHGSWETDFPSTCWQHCQQVDYCITYCITYCINHPHPATLPPTTSARYQLYSVPIGQPVATAFGAEIHSDRQSSARWVLWTKQGNWLRGLPRLDFCCQQGLLRDRVNRFGWMGCNLDARRAVFDRRLLERLDSIERCRDHRQLIVAEGMQ
jgi:hypothetical protein